MKKSMAEARQMTVHEERIMKIPIHISLAEHPRQGEWSVTLSYLYPDAELPVVIHVFSGDEEAARSWYQYLQS